ncbi:MAG TPA: DUF222 domain-containing protein [Intrasporangium sp.]|uniref:HNH endonuclease signature motif containing protein n=1 Tax=Intrasporangium sp. TaxID=1925024 RepID=UPI002D77D1D6|nr:DUF222 domain-containing protein [Intrasporangium sp.]HET7397855.1 DUF222 domain-containing protein [Intrasporangium sp.]
MEELTMAEPPRTDESSSGHALPDLLAAMAATVRLLVRDYPTWQLPEAAVGASIAQAQEIRELAQTLSAVLVGEAEGRGLGSDQGLSRTDWVRAQADRLDVSGAAALTTLAGALLQPKWTDLAERVRTGQVSVGKATRIVRFEKDMVLAADREHLADVVASLVEHAATLDDRQLTRLLAHARATLRPPAEQDRLDEAQRAARLFSRRGTSAGMIEYYLRLDAEGAALLDAAVDPLARPRPDCDAVGEERGDPRTPGARRADALLELVSRAMCAPEGAPRTEKARLLITMSLDALLGKIRGAGLAGNGEVLSAATCRRIACDAGIIPAVLGGKGELLDLGEAERFFTPAQKRALAIRDGGCTFPRCTMPPQWCDAHHVRHWIDGGRTDLDNGALLCGRHHPVVHVRGYTATVTATGVTWHV